MSDLTQELGRLLSDPQTMEQIKSLSGLLGQPAAPANSAPPPSAPPSPQSGNDLLPAVMRFMPLLNSLREDDDTIRLLRAVAPFLSEPRRERLEQAIKILRVIRLVPLLREQGVLDLLGGGNLF